MKTSRPRYDNNPRRILFIHKGSSAKDAPRIRVMPMGLIALADHLANNGFETQVLNFEVETALDPGFDIVRYIKTNHFGVVCFDLFWHFQTRAVIQTAKEIKSRLKGVWTILGGITASCFDAEILKLFPWIDFVIRGDAEIPLLDLARKISARDLSGLDSIPNLSWKKSGRIRRNQQSYTTPQKIFDLLNYASFDLVRHHEFCSTRNLMRREVPLEDLGLQLRQDQKTRPDEDKIFFFNCGRGCAVDCSCCGGGRLAQKLIHKRNKILLMSTASALRQFQKAVQFGYGWWFTDFFPHTTEKYYRTLFGEMRKQGLKLKASFYCCGLPGKKFLDEFKKTFRDDSWLEIAPLSGSDRVRKANKGYYYSNARFKQFLAYLSSKKILCSLSFTAGLPFENKKDIRETLQLIRWIKRFFPQFEIASEETIMEPASPWFLHKKSYGIIAGAKNFSDFYSDKAMPINYRTKKLGKKEVLSALSAMKACWRTWPLDLNQR